MKLPILFRYNEKFASANDLKFSNESSPSFLLRTFCFLQIPDFTIFILQHFYDVLVKTENLIAVFPPCLLDIG